MAYKGHLYFSFYCVFLWLLKERPSMNAHSMKETNRTTSTDTTCRCVGSHLITIAQYADEAECYY